MRPRQLVFVCVALALVPSCALIDAFNDDGDDTNGPGPFPDDAGPINNCAESHDLGDISGGSLSQFAICETGLDLNFSGSCSGNDTVGGEGIIVSMFSPSAADYMVCANGLTPNSLLSIQEGPCTEQPTGFCVVTQDGCIITTLGPGAIHLYWEPGVRGCENVDIDVTPIMPTDR